MKTKIYKILKLLRPKQWIKNFAVFAAIFFSRQFFNYVPFTKAFIAFIVFCGLSSAIYIINDIFDIKKDQMHPFKRFRPLAHGDLSIQFAIVLATILICASLFLGFFVTTPFFFAMFGYLFLQFAYSLLFKHIAVIDILAVASGYILRIYGGELATGYHISVWLLLTTIALSLFLAIGKRRSELTLISHFSEAQIKKTRETLSHYSERLLDVYASIFATATFIFYSFFTFFEDQYRIQVAENGMLPNFFPDFFQRKWLMITILPVVYGLMRYLQDIYEKHEGESPEKVLLSDLPLLTTVIGWVVLLVIIIYFVRT